MRSCFWLVLAVGCTSSQTPTAYLDPTEPRTTDDLAVFFEGGSGGGTAWTFHWFKDGQRMPDLEESTLSAEHTARDELWQVALIPDDISAWSLGEASITILNTPPVTLEARLAPEAPTTEDDIVFVHTEEDADGDDVTWDLTWRRDQDGVQAFGFTLPASQTAKGDRWVVTATPDDGTDQGEQTSLTVDVGNTAPVINDVTLSTTAPIEGETVAATVDAEDADEDSLTFTYAWSVNNAPLATNSASLSSANFSFGNTVEVTVTPSDGTITGAVEVLNVTVSNSPPVVSNVGFSPASPQTNDTLTVTYDITDADGHAVDHVVVFYVTDLNTGSTQSHALAQNVDTLDGSLYFDHQDMIQATVEVTDPFEPGNTASSSPIFVANTPPTAAQIEIQPTLPVAYAQNLHCQVNSESTDEDNHSLDYQYTWEINGGGTFTSNEMTNRPGDTLDATLVAEGTITCNLTPTDFFDDGPTTTASITVSLCDGDGDGEDGSLYGTCAGTDCDDTDPAINSWATEVCGNDVDEDCDGTVNGCSVDYDANVTLSGGSNHVMLTPEVATVLELDGSVPGCAAAVVGLPFTDDPWSAVTYPGGVFVIPCPMSDWDVDAFSNELYGDSPDMEFGAALGGDTDLDGDGFNDLVVGAPGYDSDRGSAYVFSGPISGYSQPITAANVMIWGDASAAGRAGAQIGTTADLSLDNFDDLVLTAPGDDAGGTDAGSVYVLTGPLWANYDATFQLGTDETMRYTGVAGDALGTDLDVVGDVNGDGLEDLLIGAPGADINGQTDNGAVYLQTGWSTASASMTIEDTAQAVIYRDISDSDSALSTCAGVGDFDDDGYDDVAVSDTSWRPTGQWLTYNYGKTWVIHNGDLTAANNGVTPVPINVDDASLAIEGSVPSGKAGWSLEGGSDITGDGVDDLLIGAWRTYQTLSTPGAAYIVSGTLTGTVATSELGSVIGSSGSLQGLGRRISTSHDIDGNGFNDVFIAGNSGAFLFQDLNQ